MIRLIAPDRGNDPWGAGHFGASRGSSTHTGHDVAAWPGSAVLAKTDGMITDIGFAYTSGVGAWNAPDPYRIITVTGYDCEMRYYYVDPMVGEGDEVIAGNRLGFAQDLWRRYPPEPGKIMTPHVHIDVIVDGKLVDPKEYFGA